MGYHTEFEGKFKITPCLPQPAVDYIKKFCETRRVKRHFDDNIHGVDGEFYIDGVGFMGQDDDESVVDGNTPPSTQPGLWCQWMPSDDGNFLEWDQGEKFYEYTLWLSYMINSFFEPNDFKLNGEVSYQGADPKDSGVIYVKDNIITDDSKIMGVANVIVPRVDNVKKLLPVKT